MNFVFQRVWSNRDTPQGAQKGRSARPQRGKGQGGTIRTSCGPFALTKDFGERKSPSSASDLLESLRYVETLSDARTMHENRRVLARQGWEREKGDFFSILRAYFRSSNQRGTVRPSSRRV